MSHDLTCMQNLKNKQTLRTKDQICGQPRQGWRRRRKEVKGANFQRQDVPALGRSHTACGPPLTLF